MKQLMQGVATIALAIGLATAAQAAGYQESAQPTTNKHTATAPMHRTVSGDQMQRRSMSGRVTKEQIREAQQQLKSEGLFKGKIDGKMSHQFKVALSHFQQQNGLKRTAKLDHNTLARLSGGTSGGAGVGSSLPTQRETTPMMNTPTTPSPTTGAGGATNGATNPSSTSPGTIGAPKQP
jgi:hypothetical protein